MFYSSIICFDDLTHNFLQNKFILDDFFDAEK